MEIESNRCCIYFIDWQYASEDGQEYLNPSESQYKETIILMSAKYKGESVAYCPYIWVNQDKALMRGIFQGWPNQFGDTHISRSFGFETLYVEGKRFIEGIITYRGNTIELPQPSFSNSCLLRYFPNLERDKHHLPLINELVQLRSREVQTGSIRKGTAGLKFLIGENNELSDFKPLRVKDGYQFEISLIVDDLKPLEKLISRSPIR